MAGSLPMKPAVWLVGDVDHRDFAEAVALVRSTANVGPGPPEVIVIAQSRPGTIRAREVEQLRRSVAAGRSGFAIGELVRRRDANGPASGRCATSLLVRVPNWWRRQISLRTAGRCPEWARVEDFSAEDCGLRIEV